MQFRIRESQLVPEKTLTIAWSFLQKAGEVEKCSDFGVWSLIPADGAYCCGGSSKVRDVKYTATVDNCVMQLRTCESQLINLKWIDDSLEFRAKNWKQCIFADKKFVTAPLAFNVGFEGVPLIWVKPFLVSEVLRYTGRLRKSNIRTLAFKKPFLGPLHFLHPLSGGCGTRLSISSWDEDLVYFNPPP